MRRRLIALALVALLGGALVVAVALAPGMLRTVALGELRAAGFADATVGGAAIGMDGVRFTDVTLDEGGALHVDAAVLPWSFDLLRGVVRQATLVGPRVVVDARSAATGAKEFRWGPAPRAALLLRNALLVVLTDLGSFSLAFEATATPTAPTAPTAATVPTAATADAVLRFDGRGTFRHDVDPALLVPVAATVAVDWTAAGLAIRGQLADAGSGLDVAVAGAVQPGAGTGDLRLTGGPLRIAPDHPLAAVSPVLARVIATLVRDPAGTVVPEGRLAWRPGSAAVTTARVRLEGVRFASDAGTVAGLSGTVAFADLDPLRLDGVQRLRLGRAESGFALEDVDVELRQNPAGAAVVQRAAAAALGGRLEAGPLTVSRARQRTTVRIRAVSLADVLALGGVPGLNGTGQLSGELTVAITPDAVTLERGEIAAAAPGTLAYVPRDAAGLGEQAAMMLGVLSDFRYERLAVTFMREAGALVGRMRIEGRNPAFQDGRPVVLNVNLTGDVEQTVQAALGFYRLPAEIMHRIESLEPGRR